MAETQPNVVNSGQLTSKQVSEQSHQDSWVTVVLLIGILLLGGYFRFVGLNWDDNLHLHPDERFLTMVSTAISFPKDGNGYFNTEHSSLNPHNRGYGFYVYGTLPLFLVRYLGEMLDKTGYDQIHLVGRFVTAIFDLLTIFLVYLIASRLYRRKRLGLLAAAFSAFAVLQIQLSHFYTVDIYANFFIYLGIYFAVHILTAEKSVSRLSTVQQWGQSGEAEKLWWRMLVATEWRSALPFAWFGVALGMAMSCKVSAAPVALLLPTAAYLQFLQIPEDKQKQQIVLMIRNLFLAALISFIVFRIFQPYAFAGPGFFDIGLNQRWLDNLAELSRQSSGDVDFPPALQWARRPITFAWENMVLWGLGVPLGLLAWGGFLWMGWRIFRGEGKKHALIWGWTAVYFVWQSLNFSRSMRYQLPIYPSLAIIAAWTVFMLWDLRSGNLEQKDARWITRNWHRILAAFTGAVILISTFLWAYAFTQIYQRPVTRWEASYWIYQNVPAAINLRLQTSEGMLNQPLPYRAKAVLTTDQPIYMTFRPLVSGALRDVSFTRVVDPQLNQEQKALVFVVSPQTDRGQILGGGILLNDFTKQEDPRGAAYTLEIQEPVYVEAGKTYSLTFSLETGGKLELAGPITIGVQTPLGVMPQSLADPVQAIRQSADYILPFTATADGLLTEVFLPHIVDWENLPQQKTLRLSIMEGGGGEIVGVAEIRGSFVMTDDPRGDGYVFKFDQPVALKAHQPYTLRLWMAEGNGAIGVYGSKQALESSWDDPLPMSLAGYNNPFDYELGVYRTELNFEMYWDDNTEKLNRFLNVLNQADYIFISSNRQWGTTVRVPERYPLTTAYYRNLLGCPEDRDIVWCYRVAEPGMFEGKLGFELIKVFESYPNLGNIRFNTQFAEEAFTVYDHPKVFIFQKRSDYNPLKVQAILSKVDLSRVVHLTPRKAIAFSDPALEKNDLMLPDDLLQIQRQGGTWSELFDYQVLYNRYPILAAVLWYLAITLLGWTVYPLVRIALSGLEDKGYPLSRLAGMLILAYLVWLVGSLRIPVTKGTIWIVFAALVVLNGGLFMLQRKPILCEIRTRRQYFLLVEGIVLTFFLLFLLIRLGNPDLWHPYKGGEKPMDFSYLNAVIKSTVFPPYDPWFAGGYLNYYYFGFVLVGIPIKALGIVPSIAYNLFLPTLFSLLGIGAFSAGWNLIASTHRRREEDVPAGQDFEPKWLAGGLTTSIGLLILGNLGTVRMIWHGLQRLVAPIPIEEGTFFQRWIWTFQGLSKFISHPHLPYAPGDWYWIPSRVIPGEPITEFPFFTFLYADPHAHLFALPLTVMALVWMISLLRGRWNWKVHNERHTWLHFGISLLFGGLVIGALRPTNTWDLPTYLTLAVVTLLYTAGKYANSANSFNRLSPCIRGLVIPLISVLLLVGLTFLFYQPYARWYGQGYNAVDLWKGDHTPFWSYITHWGLFLFVIVSWMFWETIDWMAKTPVSALNKLRKWRGMIFSLLILLLVCVFVLLFWGVQIGWLVLPLAVWTAILILRPGQSDAKRAVLFMIGSALVLTLAVEVVVLRGDIGRMNTVFKFYLQAWTLFAVSGGSALVWLYPGIERQWSTGWRFGWRAALTCLVFGAALFPLMGGMDKITDRMSALAPHTLDGMAFMQYASYNDVGNEYSLAEDYRAIRWMHEHIQGSPVIVEGNTPEYRWGSRYTIYTGLPGVVGWNWHQRQQRAILPSNRVTDRVDAVGWFYNTVDPNEAVKFLRTYDVRYIIVGKLERANYNSQGLAKFKEYDGIHWKTIYHDGDTSIYEVIQSSSVQE